MRDYVDRFPTMHRGEPFFHPTGVWIVTDQLSVLATLTYTLWTLQPLMGVEVAAP